MQSVASVFLSGRFGACLWLALATLASLDAEKLPSQSDALVVHEWGTFTSVADEHGDSVSWLPLSGPPDLPCFVHRLGGPNIKLSAFGTVRMETPVLYFYTALPMTLSVQVDFPHGRITELYPRAAAAERHVTWDPVELEPGSAAELPVGKGASHYYAARDTDSVPLRVGQEREKLIFLPWRGHFLHPAGAQVSD